MDNAERSVPEHPSRTRRVLALLAACALVLTGVGLFVLHGPPGASGSPSFPGGGPSSSVEAGGLTYTLQLSPGPYFVGELVAVNLTLTNASRLSYPMWGAPRSHGCGQAMSAFLSGGGAPTYTLPTNGFLSCPLFGSTLSAGQTWTLEDFLPLTASGSVTLTAHAAFVVSSTGAGGVANETSGAGPFARGWPSLRLSVAPTTPAGHTLSLHTSMGLGPAVVTITAPQAACSHLYYVSDVACSDGGQGSTESPSLAWLPVGGTTLREPGCPGSNETWTYSIGAPGYAIASGRYPTDT